MNKSILAMIFIFNTLPGPLLLARQFELQVEHLHALRNCRGTLIVSPEAIRYQTKEEKDAREWRYTDIQSIKVIAPRSIEIITYEDQKRLLGRDRIWKFRLSEGEVSSELSGLFAEKAARPAVTNVPGEEGIQPLFTIPVKHRHILGGCDGVLKVFPEWVMYESADLQQDSRVWRYSELDGFAHYERFSMEFITHEHALGSSTRTFDFELKADLPSQVESYIRVRLKDATNRRPAP